MGILFKSKVTILLLSISISLSILLGFSISSLMNMEKPIRIVDLTQMSQDDVLLWANENDIVVETVEAYDENSAVGTILSQDITAGDRLFAGQKIIITLSKGPDPDVLVNVGDFNGQDIGVIQTFIDNSKLMNAHILFEKSDKVETSYLISQSVTNQDIKRSDLINFVISTGTKDSLATIVVPDFSTFTKTEISSWGAKNNITINFIEEFNSTVEKGIVYNQSLVAQSEIYDGSSLTIKISKGAGVVLANLVGKTKTEIDKIISDNNLKVTYDYAYSSSTAKDVATSMSPSTNTRVEEGTSVSVVLSFGKVSMSNYTGKSLSELQSWVNGVNADGANLKISSSIAYSDSVTSGLIITQSPSTGDVNPGTSITVSVSKGGGVTVKTFTSRSDTQDGLKVSISEKYSSSASGTVLSQSIAAGTKVDSGTTITLTVSIGQVPVSSKIGGTLADLQTWVNSVNGSGANLSISSSEAYTDNQADKGKITSQSPSSGTVAPGSTITAVVSKGTQVTVATFTGTSTTSQTGLTVNRSEQYSSSVANGVVISQSISAGTRVDYGTSISLVISKGQDPATLPTTVPYVSDIPESITSTNLQTYKDAIASRFSSAAPTLNLAFATTSDGTSCGMVRSVNPGQGSTVNGGTTVTVTLDTTGCN